ncbi:MAG: BACON domain-containing protein [Bryobacteraceae bacterium]
MQHRPKGSIAPAWFALFLAASACLGAEPAVFFEPLAISGRPDIRFAARRGAMASYITPSGTILRMHAKDGRSATVTMTLAGAQTPRQVQGGDRQAGVTHYYRGADPSHWRTGVPHFGSVQALGVYPGIDLIHNGSRSLLEYDFRVAPGADPARIRMHFNGATPEVTAQGDLVLSTPVRDVIHRKPIAYQQADGRRVAVPVSFQLAANGDVGFDLGDFRRDLPLVIDPVVVYSTYVGGSGSDEVSAVAPQGASVYICGSTDSTDFGAGTRQGETDVYLAKLDAAGNILYTVLFGGELADFGLALAVNAAGTEVAVAGSTLSTSFAGTAGAHQTTQAGGFDAFISRLDATNGMLIRSTFYGGSGADEAKGVAYTAAGKIVAAGNTLSPNLPLLNAIDSTLGGPDGFLAQFSASLSALEFGTYVGGSAAEFVNGFALDSGGRAVLGGQTYSNDLAVQGAFQAVTAGLPDGFVTRVDLGARAINYSTYLGGALFDAVQGVAPSGANTILVTGFTESTDFPTTAGAWSRTVAGGADIFAARLNGPALDFSTLIGGSGNDSGAAVAAGPNGAIAVAGKTLSLDFPTVAAMQVRPLPEFPDRGDTVLFSLNASGNVLYSTYHSGGLDDAPLTLAYDSGGRLFLGGRTSSLDLPLAAPADASYGGFSEGFLAAIDPGPAAVPVTFETSPAGRSVIVDDVKHSTPVALQWLPGVKHRIDADAAAFEPPNHTFVWSSWTGTPAATPRQQEIVAPASAATYRANFNSLVCPYTVTPSTQTVPVSGASFLVDVQAPANCPWDAASNVPWISGGATGRTGNGSVNFVVSPGPASRTGTIAVAFQDVTVNQLAGIPSVAGVSPAFGSALDQTFTFTFQDSNGADDLDIVNVLINSAIDGRQACYLAYAVAGPTSGAVYLVNDAGDSGGPFAGTFALPGTGTASNSACTVNGAGSSASMNGNTLTLVLRIAFKTPLGGNRIVYQAARDKGGLNSGWTARGVWRVPGGITGPASVTGLAPQRVSANNAVLTATFNAQAGAQPIGVINILINNAIDGRSACYLALVASEHRLLLVNDSGDGGGPYAGDAVIPKSGAIGNSQCSINTAGSSYSASGTTATLALSLNFLTPFRGDRIVYAAIRGANNTNSGWQPVGTITVP